MKNTTSADDVEFRLLFEQGIVADGTFDHYAHLRLAYIFLCDHNSDAAVQKIRAAIQNYLTVQKISLDKYHETLTQAWVQTVRHFMSKSQPCNSAEEFIDQNPGLLDSTIMLTHYSRDLLYSEDARLHFDEPDKEPIPQFSD